ncbi:hypothetical protein GGI25_005294 [Coemansia spiralis]|uniref:Fanconi anemia group D2 protein n=2 Tax=Coemansia TaxID=4863 RepID=A0A9W8KVV1_9FUNG|nr:hypothetical protein EDC05_005264 [Coemansia umbellata]KAJ2619761.1 hypothetical protein GGI26_005571 [Coemansia sp. RSA 1358]KAJ2671951.1 hypothetical protein GGI25_005294 [Coemansia spiralis]
MEDKEAQRCQELFASCGVELVKGKVPTLHTSAALFRYKLNDAIARDAAVAQMCGDHIDSLLAEHDTLAFYLDPVSLPTTATQSGTSGMNGSNMAAHQHTDQLGLSLRVESFVRLVLGVDALQPRVIATLLEKFPEFIGDEDSIDDQGATKVSVKILRQLRWLDYVIDSANLLEKLLETLGFVPPEMQSEIISALPDIISDADSVQVSKVLAGMMKSTPELMLPILETLGSLECPPHLLQEARNSVLVHLVSADPIDLPVMVRFLLQSASPDSAGALIVRIRKRLDLDSIVLATRQQHSSTDDQTPDVLIFDVVANCLRSHKHLRDAWLKTIASDNAEVGSHTTLDFAVLLMLHQITTHAKRVETILRGKIEAVSLQPIAYTPNVVESIIKRFPAVFSAHFSALLSVAGWLIQTSPLGSQGSQVASAMVVSAFGAMGMFQRQEISGELAVHIGSGNANEMDTAARTYLELAKKYPHELRPFAIFIKGLLDYVDTLSIEHVRIIFDVLGILSTLRSVDGGGDGGPDSSMFNDLYIFVRKQLASVYPKYNRIGIVGTVAFLRQLGSKDSAAAAASTSHGSSSSRSTTTQGANIHALRRAVQLLEMLMDSGRHQSWAFISMTYDELAHVVETKGLHQQLLTWLHENVSSTFATQFLGDPELLSSRYMLPSSPSVALSLDNDELAILDIFNHNNDAANLGLHRAIRQPARSNEAIHEAGCEGGDIENNKDSSKGNLLLRGCLLSCLPSLLRLIQVCEKALSEGSLTEIDSLLVCGMYLLPPVDIDATISANSASLSATRYVIIKPEGGADSDASAQISESALVGVNEEARQELVNSIQLWPQELRRICCTSLYTAANWIREIINAFSNQPSAEMRSKVVMRANQLWQIESDLVAIAASLDGTSYEFHPVTAGLIPEVSDSPAAWMTTSGPSLRPHDADGNDNTAQSMDVEGEGASATESSQKAQLSELAADACMVNVDGLLLSQDDTIKLVGYSADPVNNESDADDGGKKRGRKRKSGGSRPSTFSASTASTLLQGTNGSGEGFTRLPALYLRELSLSAFSILDISTIQAQCSQQDLSSYVPRLSAQGLYVILRELNTALSAKLVQHGDKRPPFQKQQPGVCYGQLATFSSNIASCSANDLVDNLLPLFPSLLKYLENCLVVRARFCRDATVSDALAKSNLHVLASVETPDDVKMIEQCIDTILQIISSVVRWDGLQGDLDRQGGSPQTQPRKALSTLNAFLGSLAEQGMHIDSGELVGMDKNALVRQAFDYIYSLADLVATSTRAIHVLRMLLAIRELSPHSEKFDEVQCMPAKQRAITMDGQISNMALCVLSDQWSGIEQLKPGDMEYVITQHIMRYPHNRLDLVHAYATKTLPQFISNAVNSDTEDDSNEASVGGIHNTLRDSTFVIYYKVAHQILAAIIKGTKVDEMSGQELLAFAAKVGESWLSLAKLTQTTTGAKQRSILLYALRGGYVLVDLFTKQLLPHLDKYFLVHRDGILLVFSRVQKSTRILQNICNHSKVAKDTKLQSIVPQMKRRLEQLVFQVFAMMENNDCIGAINMGNLKHRDISGAVVGSQIPFSGSEEDEEEAAEDDIGLGMDIELPNSDGEEEQAEEIEGYTENNHGHSSRRRVSTANKDRALDRPPLPIAANKRSHPVERKKRFARQRKSTSSRIRRKHTE